MRCPWTAVPAAPVEMVGPAAHMRARMLASRELLGVRDWTLVGRVLMGPTSVPASSEWDGPGPLCSGRWGDKLRGSSHSLQITARGLSTHHPLTPTGQAPDAHRQWKHRDSGGCPGHPAGWVRVGLRAPAPGFSLLLPGSRRVLQRHWELSPRAYSVTVPRGSGRRCKRLSFLLTSS